MSTGAVSEAGIFDPARSASVDKARRRGDRLGNTDNMRVLAVLSTQLLHQQFIADRPAPARVDAASQHHPRLRCGQK